MEANAAIINKSAIRNAFTELSPLKINKKADDETQVKPIKNREMNSYFFLAKKITNKGMTMDADVADRKTLLPSPTLNVANPVNTESKRRNNA